MLSGPSFRPAFVFSVNSSKLSGFSFDFFSFSWSFTIYFFMASYSCMCAVVQNITNCLLFIIIHIFSTHFCNQPVLFAQLENVNKLWNNNLTMNVNERFKNKNKTKSRHIQIDDLAHKKCNGIIKDWHHCLTSVSKGRLFVNNKLISRSAWS